MQCAAEVAGTCLLTFVGTSSVASAVLTGAQQGLWQVAIVWGIGVALAIYCTAHISEFAADNEKERKKTAGGTFEENK